MPILNIMALTSATVPSTWKLLLDQNTIQQALINLSTHINKDYSTGNLILLGVLTGAAYFTVDLSRKLTVTHQVNFLRVSSYHDSQTASDTVNITGLSDKELDNLSTKHILILDELYDSGRTLHEVTSYLHQFNPLSIKTCVMFRKSKKSKDITILNETQPLYSNPDYCGIDNLPDVWYVGYGLYDCGTKREWNDLYAVPKSFGIPTNSDDLLFDEPNVYTSLLNNSKVISPIVFNDSI